MKYAGYCAVHELCTVFVFESNYRDRSSIARNMPRVIADEFGYPGASFDLECYPIGSERGENVSELAEMAARDAVGNYAGCDEIMSAYRLHGEIIEVMPRERTTAREMSTAYGVPLNMAQTLLDALCDVHGAQDESECANDLSRLLANMTAYYN